MKHAKKITVCAVAMIISVVMSKHSHEIRTSQHGLETIGNAEGCMRDPYKCPADVLTVGVGSTQAGGDVIDVNKTYTDEEIAERWIKDIQIAERCVKQNIEDKTNRKLPQSVYDSIVSITFNVGCGKIKNSTLYRKAIKGDFVGICNEFPRWVYSGGRKLKGLELRREKEKQLCLTDLQKF
ncbi:TPA: lysozyme [Pasteurella multocida]